MVDFDFVDFEELEKLREEQKEKSTYEYAQLQIPNYDMDFESRPKEPEQHSVIEFGI